VYGFGGLRSWGYVASMDLPTGPQLQAWWGRVPEPLKLALMAADPDDPVAAELVADVAATDPPLVFGSADAGSYRLPERVWAFITANSLLRAYLAAESAWRRGPAGPALLAARNDAKKAYHANVYGLVD
jgi:hypothetical protein